MAKSGITAKEQYDTVKKGNRWYPDSASDASRTKRDHRAAERRIARKTAKRKGK
jgi:hypothetical protein